MGTAHNLLPLVSNKRASAVIEYMALVVFILAAFMVFQQYILRGFSGRWKAVGDTFSHGRQYDPRAYGVQGAGGGTLECFHDRNSGRWVSTRCFEQNCSSTGKPCHNLLDLSVAACQTCISTCIDADCGD